MRETLSKGLDRHSTRQISYATVMSEFRHVDCKSGCYVLHESCIPMYYLSIEINHA
jgi:hypothetical protein